MRGETEGRGVDSPEFHNIRLGNNTLRRPARQLTAVVLHLRRHNGSSLCSKLGAPVQRAPAPLRFTIELVQRFDSQELVVAGDVIFHHGIQLRAHN